MKSLATYEMLQRGSHCWTWPVIKQRILPKCFSTKNTKTKKLKLKLWVPQGFAEHVRYVICVDKLKVTQDITVSKVSTFVFLTKTVRGKITWQSVRQLKRSLCALWQTVLVCVSVLWTFSAHFLNQFSCQFVSLLMTEKIWQNTRQDLHPPKKDYLP